MALLVEKKKKFSSVDRRRFISSDKIGEYERVFSFMKPFGGQRSVLLVKKMNKRRIMRKIWVCNDLWMDIFPFFDRPQLGLKMAMLSPRFDALVDKHFNEELTICCKLIKIVRIGQKQNGKFKQFPMPNHSLPNNIRFKNLKIEYIDHSVITFLRSNQQIFDGGTNLRLHIPDFHIGNVRPIWDAFVHEIWPIFATNIRRLDFRNADHLAKLCRLISPTILTDLNALDSIDSAELFLANLTVTDFDGQPNTTATTSAGQALSKWLHTPRMDGQPKRLCCGNYKASNSYKWVDNFKEAFLRGTTSSASAAVSYNIQFIVRALTPPIVPFELVNERTQEKLTLSKEAKKFYWLLKRCPIIGETAIQRKHNNSAKDDLNNVYFYLRGANNCLGPLSPPAAAAAKGQIKENAVSSDCAE